MQISPEAVTPSEVAGCGGSLQQERPVVRRRMVQSTLFPHKSPENATKKVVEIRDQQDGDDDEEYCSSQGKKKRGRKPKAAANKVALDGRETSSRKVDDTESPVTVKSTLCTIASNGAYQQKDQPLFGSPGKEDETEASSPVQSTPNMKRRQQLKKPASSTPKKRVRTPKKNTMNGGQKGTCTEKISDPSSQGEAAIQPVPDLRLEEKLKAEEIARVFGGKGIHPFFSSCKSAKKTQQQTKDMDGFFVDGKNKGSILGPIHVFEKVQDDDAGSLNWGSWVLSDRSLVGINCDRQTVSSPVFDVSVNSLSFDNSLKFYPRCGAPLFQSEAIQHEILYPDQSPITTFELSPKLSADDSEAQCNLPKQAQEHCHGHESLRANVSCELAGYFRITDSELGNGFPHKRTMAGSQRCSDHPGNNLWTYKHLPEKANEVCGNGESVTILSEWLHLWHERGFRSSKDLTVAKTFIVEDDDYDSSQSDSDPESRDEDDGLKNVLLLTGPVGSGKSAAIYACAKEQGFHVIEVNASDWRTRTVMMQRFGGGVESHCVQRTVEPPLDSESKQTMKPIAVISDTVNDSEVIELIPLSDDEEPLSATGIVERSVCNLSTSATNKNGSKPLILFEDVDAILSEDHGLIATIQKLAATAKRPIILTSNSQNSILPNNFDRIELCFTKPSLKELFSQVHMVCAAEKAKVQSILVERFINCCQGDLRKTIMNLQFWCQGQTSRKDTERRYDPLLFDVDAGHRILPTLISWGYPSPLSEFVDKEITQSLLMIEESSKLIEEIREENPTMKRRQRGSKRLKSKGKIIEEKKEEILRTHCLVEDDNEFSNPLNIPCDASPDAFMPRNVRRRLGTVLSSDSENENVNNTFRVVRSLLFNDSDNEMAVDSTAPSYCPETEMYIDSLRKHLLGSEEKLEETINPLTEQLCDSKEEKRQEDCSRCFEAEVYTQIDDIQKPVNIFSAPEASFVAETEMHGETSISCGHVADVADIVSTSDGFLQTVQPLWTNNLDLSGLDKNPEIVENSVSVQREEEVGDSHIGHLQAVPRGYQVMDECSRMDFNKGANSLMLINSLQEIWRKLRNCTDITQCITPVERDASLVLKLTSGMTNLISEADVLLVDCEPLASDLLEPSAVPSEKSHSFSWYDDHLWMASAIAQHGVCLYAKEIATVESKYGLVNRTDLSWEMLSSSTSTMALGKLIGQETEIKSSDEAPLESVISMRRGPDSDICSVVRSMVPPKLHLAAVKGDTCYEYLSALSKISRSEASRLSQGISNTNQRRRRAAKNYLSNGALMLSPNEISLLGQYNSYGKLLSSQSVDVNLK